MTPSGFKRMHRQPCTFAGSTRPPLAQQSSKLPGMHALHPKKLLITKWTAVNPIAKNKHFLGVKVIQPELPETAVQWIDLEAIYSKKQIRIEWRDLRDASQWKQGWV
jgi:tryptophan-rich hypothetical protein